MHANVYVVHGIFYGIYTKITFLTRNLKYCNNRNMKINMSNRKMSKSVIEIILYRCMQLSDERRTDISVHFFYYIFLFLMFRVFVFNLLACV